MTPDEFKIKALQFIADFSHDIEDLHGKTDELMEDTLIELGYGEGIKLIKDTVRYYG